MAAENQTPVEQTQSTPEERPLTKAMGKMMLASIGAVGLAQDALERLLNRMVERGELSRQEARRRMEELRARRPDLSRRGMHKLSETVRDTAELPSKQDIQQLHEQIAELSAKLDDLTRKTQAEDKA